MTAVQTNRPALPTETASLAVCTLDDLHPDRGVAALVGTTQVAIFLLSDTGEVFAVSHRDPFTGSNVIARGLVGSRGDAPTVASPLHKQVFDLRTGVCLDDPAVALETWPVEVAGREVRLLCGPDLGLGETG